MELGESHRQMGRPVSEYLDHNRLIHPRARYVGPENEEVVPLDEG